MHICSIFIPHPDFQIDDVDGAEEGGSEDGNITEERTCREFHFLGIMDGRVRSSDQDHSKETVRVFQSSPFSGYIVTTYLTTTANTLVLVKLSTPKILPNPSVKNPTNQLEPQAADLPLVLLKIAILATLVQARLTFRIQLAVNHTMHHQIATLAVSPMDSLGRSGVPGRCSTG